MTHLGLPSIDLLKLCGTVGHEGVWMFPGASDASLSKLFVWWRASPLLANPAVINACGRAAKRSEVHVVVALELS